MKSLVCGSLGTCSHGYWLFASAEGEAWWTDKNLPQVLAQDSPAFSPQNIPSDGNLEAQTLTNDRLLLASDEIKDLQILDQQQEVTKFELESEFKKKFTSESEFLKDKSGTIKTSMLSVSGEL